MSAKQTGFAEVHGARLYYEVTGDGFPLVLSHAGVADQRMWRHQVEAFARHYKVITCDLRGFGQSAMPDEKYAYYRDLHGLLAHLGVEKAHLIGASMSGATTIDFTLEYPQMVSALVLVASGLEGYDFDDPAAKAGWKAIGEAFDAGDLERVAELEAQLWIIGPGRKPEAVDPAIRELAHDMLMISYQYEGVGERQKLEPFAATRLGEIDAPTLLIVGDADVPGMLTLTDVLAEGIAGSQKVVIPDTAHLPNLEKPEVFNRHVLEFLSRVETA